MQCFLAYRLTHPVVGVQGHKDGHKAQNGGTTMSPTSQGNRTQPPPKNYPNPIFPDTRNKQQDLTEQRKQKQNRQNRDKYLHQQNKTSQCSTPIKETQQKGHKTQKLRLEPCRIPCAVHQLRRPSTRGDRTNRCAQIRANTDAQIRTKKEALRLEPCKDLCAVHQLRRPSTRGDKRNAQIRANTNAQIRANNTGTEETQIRDRITGGGEDNLH